MAARGIRVDQNPLRAIGPRLRNQYRLRLWRRVAHEKERPVNELRRVLVGAADCELAHALGYRRSVLELAHHTVRVRVLRADPGQNLRATGILEPAIWIVNGDTVHHRDDVSARRQRR